MKLPTSASVLAVLILAAVAAGQLREQRLAEHTEPKNQMYGLIAEVRTVPGQRDALVEILIDGVSGMPGCLSYIVAKDPANENTIWITEVWNSKESHTASLTVPSVQEAISKGRPLMAGFGQRIETVPTGGHGLSSVE